jgi:hypothetical protein
MSLVSMQTLKKQTMTVYVFFYIFEGKVILEISDKEEKTEISVY